MVVCPHGSAANNSALGVVEMSGTYLNSVLPGGLQWFDSYLWLIPPFTIDVPTFCAAEPPSLPVLDAGDILSIVTGGRLGTFLVGLSKARQFLEYYAWYSLCHCLVDATPPPPAPQSPPSGIPVVNPPGAGTGTVNCASQVSAQQSVPSSTFVNQAAFALPLGAQTLDITMQNIVFGATPGGMQWAYRFLDTSGNSLVGSPTLAPVASGVTRTDTVTILPNASRFEASVTAGAVTQTNKAQTSVVVNCNPSPTPVVNPIDPEASGLLHQILNLVTLIQRQIVPFAYVSGAVHAGLSGSGNLEVQGLVGARVDLTTVPGALGREGALPEEIFEAGFLTWGTDDGYPQSETIRHTPYVSLPPRASVFVDLAYDLHPGVVATITELVREP